MAIQTTVVGSYPIPLWLYGDSSKGTLRDAVSVVLHTQERIGIDVVADGELNRFDPSHPETNGMIDYFVSQFSGVHTEVLNQRSGYVPSRRWNGVSYGPCGGSHRGDRRGHAQSYRPTTNSCGILRPSR